MADADPDAIAEVPPSPLVREVLAPPVRRRWVIALAVAIGVSGAATARLGAHERHCGRHHHQRADLELGRLEANVAKLRMELDELRAAALEARQLLHHSSYGNLGAADLGPRPEARSPKP